MQFCLLLVSTIICLSVVVAVGDDDDVDDDDVDDDDVDDSFIH